VEPRSARRRAAIGAALIALGVAGILWGVFHVLAAAQLRPERLDFAHRTTSDQARQAVHETFGGGLLRALAGLALAIAGGRVRARAREQAQAGA
jgi:hypothetical protein